MKKMRDLTKEREEKIAPIAQEILELITRAELPMGDVHAHDNAKFDHIAGEVLKIFLREDIKYVDKEFVFQLVLQPIDFIKDTVILSLKKSMDITMERVFGKEFGQIGTKDMDTIMRRTKEQGN